jgi:5'-3' exonuclease
MKIHVIVDFMHIYYKYYYQLAQGRMRHLSAPLNWNGTVIKKDTTLIYHPLSEIEGIRKKLEAIGHDVTMSVCFDSKSKRKEEEVAGGAEYKEGRSTLSEECFKDIDYIRERLGIAGHNTYKFEGYEADDIVNHLVRDYKDEFDYSVIYTNDKDLLINIDDKVGAMRFKPYKGYTQVDKGNYEDYLEEEFGAFIPYNSLGLFLATVGDKADNIKGIFKFGPKSFNPLITKVASKYDIDWKVCGDYNKLKVVAEYCKEFLNEKQADELEVAINLVANITLDDIEVNKPNNRTSQEKRVAAYEELNMLSLIP